MSVWLYQISITTRSSRMSARLLLYESYSIFRHLMMHNRFAS